METAVNVSASGVADAGDILNVADGKVQIASSTIAGLGDPTVFQGLVAAATSSLESQTTQLSVSTASLEGVTIQLNQQTASLQAATASLQAETASMQRATASLELTTASLQEETSSLQ